MNEFEPDMFFGNVSLMIRLRATIWVGHFKAFIWLLFFNNLRKCSSHSFSRTFEWMYGEAYGAHLPSSEYNHHAYTKAPTLAYSLHELVDEASFEEVATLPPEVRLVIQ